MINHTAFKLPDLGEGLTEATLHLWHVKIGDSLKKDQIICTVETDKSLVDIPAMNDCVVISLHFRERDRVQVNQTLCELHYTHSHGVVGSLDEKGMIDQQNAKEKNVLKIHPEALIMAKENNLSESLLQSLTPQGTLIRPSDITQYLHHTPSSTMGHISVNSAHRSTSTIIDHCPVAGTQQMTSVLISAIIQTLNSHPWLKITSLSLAVDDGDHTHLLTPQFSEHISDCQVQLKEIKRAVKSGKIPQLWLKKSDFLISNFGSIAGRYGIPLLPSETKLALGIGRCFMENNQPVLPLTLVFDHSLYTGGQMARLLSALMNQVFSQSQSIL